MWTLERPRPWRRWVAAGALALLVLAAAGVAHADDPASLRSEAERLRLRGLDLAGTRERALLGLYVLESDLARARARTRLATETVAAARAAERRATERLATAEATSREAERRLGERLRELYKTDDPDPLEILLGAESFGEALASLDGLEQVVDADLSLVADVDIARQALVAERRARAARAERSRVSAAAARRSERALAGAVDARAEFVRELTRELDLTHRTAAELEASAIAAVEAATRLNEAAGLPPPAPAGTSPPAVPSPPAAEPAPLPTQPAPPPPAQPGPTSAAPAPSVPAAEQQPGTRTMVVEVTAYALVGTTATGVSTQLGIIAVDPSVIPLGTRMTVPGYGEGIAADTGSAVKGAIIDIWLPTVQEALQWGRRTLTITIHD